MYTQRARQIGSKNKASASLKTFFFFFGRICMQVGHVE